MPVVTTVLVPCYAKLVTVSYFQQRAIRESDEVDEFLGDISIGSTGGLHESRDRSKFRKPLLMLESFLN